jgi:hypothetical protein
LPALHMELQAQIVKSGTWLYDGTVTHEVWITRQNFDYYDDEGYQDTPSLSPYDDIFQVLFVYEAQLRSVSQACKSLDEAITLAEEKCPRIVWGNHRLQSLFHGRHYKLEP